MQREPRTRWEERAAAGGQAGEMGKAMETAVRGREMVAVAGEMGKAEMAKVMEAGGQAGEMEAVEGSRAEQRSPADTRLTSRNTVHTCTRWWPALTAGSSLRRRRLRSQR